MANKEHLHDLIERKASSDSGFAIAYAVLQLAAAQDHCARNLKRLGNGDATTQMGAIEAFGLRIGEKLDAVASALEQRNADDD